MRRLAIAAALILAASTASVTFGGSLEATVLEGAVKQRLVLDGALLKSLPAVTVDVAFETGQGQKSGRYTGVLLWSLLATAVLVDEPGKNSHLRHTLRYNRKRRLRCRAGRR